MIILASKLFRCISNKQQSNRARNVSSRTTTNRSYILVRRFIPMRLYWNQSGGLISHKKPTETVVSKEGTHWKEVRDSQNRWGWSEPNLVRRWDAGVLRRAREWNEVWRLLR